MVHTEWVRRWTIPTAFASALGTISPMLNVFGLVLLGIEVFTAVKLPCGIRFNKYITKKFDDEEERQRRELLQPLNDVVHPVDHDSSSE